ncbi:MAG: thiamine pyrophosphate-dependent dehydrogenase E1 component subunit alpha [Planctomycetota bacterium]
MNSQELLSATRMMLRIRRFEEKIEQLFSEGLIHGTTHLCIGQEAVAVGIAANLTPKDLTLSNHRGHGHFLSRGASPMRLFAELLGRVDGYCRGRGGTQHLSSIELGHLGSNGITAGSIPVACGAAFSQKHFGTGAVAVPFFGDGAVGEGYWHESMNMASLWKLPVLFVCENNYYAMSTPVSKGIAGKSIAAKAASYDIPWIVVDGNDVEAVSAAAKHLLDGIRSGKGPAFIEAQTYRLKGHSKSDGREYRTSEEEREWEEREPIRRAVKRLMEFGISHQEIARLDEEVKEEIEKALEEAKQSPFPDISEAMTNIYA